jgi:hypothetical protein
VKKRPPADFAARRAAGESILALASLYVAAERTVRAWDALPEVQAEIQKIRQAVTDEAIGQLSAAVPVAMKAVLEIARGGAACEVCGRGPSQERDRLKASEMILSRVVGLEAGERRQVVATIAADPDADARVILSEAALILDERGLPDLAAAIRAEARR